MAFAADSGCWTPKLNPQTLDFQHFDFPFQLTNTGDRVNNPIFRNFPVSKCLLNSLDQSSLTHLVLTIMIIMLFGKHDQVYPEHKASTAASTES